MRHLTLAIVAIGVASIFMACNSDANYKALTANEWSLDKIIYTDGNSSIDAPANVYVIFADSGKISGRGGCNHFFGKYDVKEQDQIAVGNVASTRMFCPDNGFENQYFDLLSKAVSYKADANKLTLTGADGKFTMLFSVRVEEIVAPAAVIEDAIEGALEEVVEEVVEKVIPATVIK